MTKEAKRFRPMQENMRIRHYVMKLLYENPGYPVALLSSRLLAEKFNVSRTTVMTALATMRKEGYLISRPGKGIYTNPNSRFSDVSPERLPLAGIVVNYGRNFYVTRREWDILSAAGNALLNAGFNFREIALNGLSPDTVFEELAESHICGLLWLLVSDEADEKLLCRVQKELFPLVTCTDPFAHPANFRRIRNFRMEEYPAPAAVAEAMVNELKTQINRKEKEKGV